MGTEDRKRRAGTVTAVTWDSDYGDPPILFVHIDFHGFSQAFGGFMVGEEKDVAFRNAVAEVLGVTSLTNAATKGREVFGLWCRGQHNESMEGIERDGKRFTISGFRRAHFPDSFKPGLERERESIQSTIAWAERRRQEAVSDLSRLDAEWTEWETMPLKAEV